MFRPFTVTWEDRIAGTPEQVWRAITAGTAGWLWEVDYEPRVGGAERGLSPAGGVVTAWEPRRSFVTQAELPSGWRNEVAWTLEPHPAGTHVRYRHDSVAEAGDWQRIFEECVAHTDAYRHSLAQSVRWFAGRAARYVGVETELGAAALRARAGLPDGLAIGDAVRLELDGLGAIDGTVDYASEPFTGVRADGLLFRIYGRDLWNDPSTLALHLFDPALDAAAAERALTRWTETTTEVA